MNHFAFITHALAVVLTLPVHGGEPLPQHDAITWRSLDLVNGVVDFGHLADELDLSNEDRQRIIDALDNIIRHAEAVKPELKPDPVPDRDGDGIPDTEDECPDDATNTCNLPTDTDGDGVPDENDPCPNDPTDKCNEPSDRDGDGIPDEQDECPDDPDDKCNDLPPIDDGLEYFDALKDHPATIFADSLSHPEDPGWYPKHRNGGTFTSHPYASYDEAYGAMRMDLPPLRSKLGPGAGIQLRWPGVGPKHNTTIVIKYRTRLSPEIVARGYEYKYVNITHSGTKIGIEHRQFMDAQDMLSRTDTRSYLRGYENHVSDGMGSLNGPSATSNYDRHPGPDSDWPYKGQPDEPPGSYVLFPGKWYVYTSEVSWIDGKAAYRQWVEDGEKPPCLLIASPADPSRGFLLGNDTASITGIYFELDQSSNAEAYDTPQERRSVWFDDLVVLKGVRGEDTLGQLTEGGE